MPTETLWDRTGDLRSRIEKYEKEIKLLKAALLYIYHHRINGLGTKVHETLPEEKAIEIGKLLTEERVSNWNCVKCGEHWTGPREGHKCKPEREQEGGK